MRADELANCKEPSESKSRITNTDKVKRDQNSKRPDKLRFVLRWIQKKRVHKTVFKSSSNARYYKSERKIRQLWMVETLPICS